MAVGGGCDGDPGGRTSTLRVLGTKAPKDVAAERLAPTVLEGRIWLRDPVTDQLRDMP